MTRGHTRSALVMTITWGMSGNNLQTIYAMQYEQNSMLSQYHEMLEDINLYYSNIV